MKRRTLLLTTTEGHNSMEHTRSRFKKSGEKQKGIIE
jgi:hypothetical protein